MILTSGTRFKFWLIHNTGSVNYMSLDRYFIFTFLFFAKAIEDKVCVGNFAAMKK